MSRGDTLVLTRSDVHDLLALRRVHRGGGGGVPPARRGAEPRPGRPRGAVAGGRASTSRPPASSCGRLYFAAKINANFPGNPAPPRSPRHPGSDRALRRRGRPPARGHGLDRGDGPAHRRRHRGRGEVAGAPGGGNGDGLRLRRQGALSSGPSPASFRCRRPTRSTPKTGHGRRVRAGAVGRAAARRPAVDGSRGGARRERVCVTCTPSRRPFLFRDQVAPGTFVAAVGADSPDKQELDPALMAAAMVVVDVLEQCAVDRRPASRPRSGRGPDEKTSTPSSPT